MNFSQFLGEKPFYMGNISQWIYIYMLILWEPLVVNYSST